MAVDFLPSQPAFRLVWERLSLDVRAKRYAEALRRKGVLDSVAARSAGVSERAAVRALTPATDRSNFRRWTTRYAVDGIEGLIDWRLPPSAQIPIPDDVRAAIRTLRQADPNVGVAVIVSHVAKHHGFKTSETTVKRILRSEGLARRRGPASYVAGIGERRLEFGGMKLVASALVETGYINALATGIVAQLESSPRAESPPPVDVSDRDTLGRFEATYNRRSQKGPNDDLAPGFKSVETKRKNLVVPRLHVASATTELIERKLTALFMSPLLGSGRWDGLRIHRGKLLEELCGFPYMPATLDLFTRELKYVGVAQTLWEIHARCWLEKTRCWGDERSASVLYIDGTTKPVWTEFFSQASKVSSLGRVMPALETVAFHSGFGVPLMMITSSGRAPLVKVVPKMLEKLDQALGDSSVGRVVVIDAEGNSIPFLKGLEDATPGRAWIVRIKASLLANKRIFNRNNYRAYRNGDRVRSGLVDLNDPDGGTFRVRVVEIERRAKGTLTYLAASTHLDERAWGPEDLADVYFERWPQQEANFRAVNQAVGAKDVHGYGKQLVDNVSVITNLERLALRIRNFEDSATILAQAIETSAPRLAEHEKELRRKERRLGTVTRKLDDLLTKGVDADATAVSFILEQRDLREGSETLRAKVASIRKTVDDKTAKLERTRERLAKAKDDEQTLNSRRTIFKHDVELDSLFGLLKVGLVLMVTFVLKEYLGNARMDVVTFLERFATLPARLRVLPEMEILTFEYNQRDPEVMALLAAQCDVLNARGLRTREGRALKIAVDPPPPPVRPPPDRSRVKTRDRFRGC
jgi:hypothetical protein